MTPGGPLKPQRFCDFVKFTQLKEPHSPCSPNWYEEPQANEDDVPQAQLCSTVMYMLGQLACYTGLVRGSFKGATDHQVRANLLVKVG